MAWAVSRSGLKAHQAAELRRLERFGPGVMLSALDHVGHETLQAWRTAINSGVSATGTVLAPLSPEYRRRKLREGYGQTTLVRTGALLRSLSYAVGERRRGVYQLLLGASGQHAFTVLMQVTGTRRGAAARDFTRLPRGWFRARLLRST
jgi:hypothetical protein